MFAEHPLQHGAIAYRPFLNGDLEFGEPCGIDGECIEFRVEHATPLNNNVHALFQIEDFLRTAGKCLAFAIQHPHDYRWCVLRLFATKRTC